MIESKTRSIETKYEVESIRCNGMQAWPMIRFALFVYHQSGLKPIEAKSMGLSKYISLIKQVFYGVSNYFRRYKYLALSDSSERKHIDGKWVDKSVDYILKRLPDSLLIELPLPNHFSKTQIPTRHIASKLPLYIFEIVYAKLFLRNIKIENEGILKDILRELDCDFDYRSVLIKNLAQYRVGKLLHQLFKPKAIIVQCSYTNIGLLKAFKDEGVTIVEVQHGLITPSHEAYNVFKDFDRSFFPDYFLSYGKTELDIFRNSYFLRPEDHVVPTGHFYLDHIVNSTRTAAEIIPESANYLRTVCITGQNLSVETKLLELIIDVAKQMPSICFFYLPRSLDSYIFSISELPDNIINAFGRDTYEIIRLSTFHSTIFSTCAVEALALGTPNILVDVDGLARLHFSKLLSGSSHTFFVETPEEYVSILQKYIPYPKEEIMDDSSNLMSSNYKKNIDSFLKEKLNG